MSDRNQEIRERAHRIWEQAGRPEGRDGDHWQQAERELHEGLDADRANEGEGSRTGAREYNDATREFVESGKVEAAAQDAADALDEGAETAELQQAEEAGKQRSRGEDPAVTAKPAGSEKGK